MTIEIPTLPDRLPGGAPRYIGKSVNRVEDPMLVAGSAQFYCWPSDGVIDGGVVLQSISQTS